MKPANKRAFDYAELARMAKTGDIGGFQEMTAHMEPLEPALGLMMLDNAIIRDQVKMARYLVEKRGVPANDDMNGQYNPLHRAMEQGANGIAEMLIANGANLNKQSRNHFPPLYMALFGNNTEGAELLVRHGADVYAGMANGDLLIHKAAREGRGHLMSIFYRRESDLQIPNGRGETPEMLAKESGCMDEFRKHRVQKSLEHARQIKKIPHRPAGTRGPR